MRTDRSVEIRRTPDHGEWLLLIGGEAIAQLSPAELKKSAAAGVIAWEGGDEK